MKKWVLLWLCCFSTALAAEVKITSVDFVQVLNENHAEAKFYYQNNWAKHREKAKSKGYIESYMLLETEPTEQAPFHFMLITTYPNQTAHEQREANFRPLIDSAGVRKLLNDIKPSEFRKILFSLDATSD